MNPGRLNKRIALQRLNQQTNNRGFSTEDWQTVATIWASVRKIRGREIYNSESTHAEKTKTFIIRYMSGIDEGMRIVYENTAFDIVNIEHLVEKAWLEITVKAVVQSV